MRLEFGDRCSGDPRNGQCCSLDISFLDDFCFRALNDIAQIFSPVQNPSMVYLPCLSPPIPIRQTFSWRNSSQAKNGVRSAAIKRQSECHHFLCLCYVTDEFLVFFSVFSDDRSLTFRLWFTTAYSVFPTELFLTPFPDRCS